MPYKDPKKQREYMKQYMRDYQRRRKVKLANLKEELRSTQIALELALKET